MSDDSPGAAALSLKTPSPADLMGLGFYTMGAHGPEPADGSVECAGRMVGQYELVEPLGEGGFGVVWLARQFDPLEREVALKCIRPGLASREAICRFEAERHALARMDHPNIAAVLDAGATEDGRPFFVMELVRGIAITAYCDLHQLTIRERMELFIPVCQAVQHAHQKAVLHRDLKPSNILVTVVDGKPVPKVIDFGIAKALAPTADSLSGETLIGTVVGTPQYMSPEQAGSGLDVDTRSDVYSLGILLCELLTGRTAMPEKPMDFAGTLRWVCESPAVRPSTLVQMGRKSLEEAAGKRRLDVRRFVRELRGDPDWITLKATEKDRSRRYGTATALARDVRRHLDGKTVSAAAPTWQYQFGKFTRRHRGVLVAAGLVSAALMAGTGVSLWQAARAEQNRVEAEANFERARRAVDLYFSRVNDNPRLQQADFLTLQRELLETALPFYEEMSRMQGENPRLRIDRSKAFSRLTAVYRQIGEHKKAEDAGMAALQIETRLSGEYPGDPVRRQSLASRWEELGVLYLDLDRKAEALEAFSNAQSLQRRLVSDDPAEPQYALALSISTRNKGTVLRLLKRPDEARTAFREAGELAEKLMAAYPGNADYQQQSAASLMTLGDLHRASREYDPAEKAYLKSIGIQQQIIQDHPRERGYRRILVLKYMNYGQMLGQMERAEEGVGFLNQALDQGQRLVDEFPTYNVYREMMVDALTILWQNYEDRGLAGDAEVALERMRGHQENLVSAVPQSAKYRRDLSLTTTQLGDLAWDRGEWSKARSCYERSMSCGFVEERYRRLAEICQRMGDHPATADTLRKWIQTGPVGWEPLVQSAGLLTEVLPAVEEDPDLNSEERLRLREAYSLQIVDWLRQAIAKGFQGISGLAASAPYAPLLPRSDFQSLMGKLSASHSDAPPDTGRAPAGFRLDYHAGNDPGPRRWTRKGEVWTEVQPSGITHRFEVERRLIVDNIPGTEILREGEPMTLFIPDRDTPEPAQLKVRGADGGWGVVGNLSELE